MEGKNGSARDFVIRRRTPTMPQLGIIFLSGMLIAGGIILTISSKLALILTLAVLAIAIGWYVMLQIQRSRDLLLATEFQNALFASALGLNNRFCLIIRRDGSIVYLDRSFQDMFPDFLRQSRRTVDMLLETGKVSKEESTRIFAAIDEGVYEKVVFEIRSAGGQFKKIVMSIEPILRPSGFILLRGREFIEARSADGTAADRDLTGLFNRSSITLFSHVMDTMNMGVYMTGPEGSIIYANPVLEHWLGYREGEITSTNLTLQDIIYKSGERAQAIQPDDYEGEARLQNKTGGTMNCFINQKIIRDEHGKAIGCTALVHNFSHGVSNAGNLKKKSW